LNTAERGTPPVFIVVCDNTTVSKLVYDLEAGWQKDLPDGGQQVVPGRLRVFFNEENGRWTANSNTRRRWVQRCWTCPPPMRDPDRPVTRVPSCIRPPAGSVHLRAIIVRLTAWATARTFPVTAATWRSSVTTWIGRAILAIVGVASLVGLVEDVADIL
jgi:hypothetical protein